MFIFFTVLKKNEKDEREKSSELKREGGFYTNKNFIIDRNKLFTAITRSKGWVNLTGTKTAKHCNDEIEKLRQNDYKLVFTQPNIKETRTILRGMNQQQSFLNEILPKIEKFSKTSGLSAEEILEILATQKADKK